MNYTAINHPSEEILTDCALDVVDSEVEHHLSECQQCKEFIEDVRMISNDIASLGEQDVPQHLHEKILSICRNKMHKNLLTFIQSWYKNPFFYGILTILFSVFMYVVFTILL